MIDSVFGWTMRIVTFGMLAACNTGREDDAFMRHLAAGERDNIEVGRASSMFRRSSAWSTSRVLLHPQLQQCSMGLESLEAAYPHKDDAAS